MKIIIAVFGILLIALGALVLAPAPIQSQAFIPDPIAADELWRANDALQSTRLTQLPDGALGGEDVARDALGCLYTGVSNGDILRFCPQVKHWQVLINTGGRPLGLAFDQEQQLIIADGVKGLLKLTGTGELITLANSFNGQPLLVVDDVDIGADGTLYFSDASSRFDLKDYIFDALDAQPSGRLFSFNPQSGELTLLASDLFFANGVAVSAQQDFVLVNESFAYRISRVWLKGERAGQKDIFADQLPGIPDGIARGDNNHFWLALYAPRSELVDSLHPQPWLKDMLAKLPQWLMPVPKPYGFIAQFNPQGELLQSLHDPQAVAIGEITSVQPEDDGLYLGTLHSGVIGHYSLGF